MRAHRLVAAGRSSVTTSLCQWVERLVTLLLIRHVADLVGLHWHTVKTIDKRCLERDLPEPDPSRLRRLIIDEFALYRSTAMPRWSPAPTPSRWYGSVKVVPARRSARFFKWLGEAREQIEAVAMDMNSAFDLEVKDQCPNAVAV